MTASIAPDLTPDAQAERVFSKSIFISGIRCVLAYVFFPFVAPLLGFADVGPWVGVVISLVAIYFNGYSIKRFWAANHRLKYFMTTLNLGVIVLVTILFVIDLQAIFG